MILGIDLGTTFSAVAYIDTDGKAQIIPNRDGDRTTPSVVMFEDGDVCIGKQAKTNSIIDPYNVCQFVKRQMGNSSYCFETEHGEKFSAEDISAMILKRLKEDAEKFLGKRVDGAVITVPAYFSDAQRKATQDAGTIAGLLVPAVINEPTAAAIAFCQGTVTPGTNVMVFDLGGGTFDVTIMRLNAMDSVDIIATGGHKNLGGFDFDNVLINHVVSEFESAHGIDLYDDDNAMQDVREKCEAAKLSLSTRNKTSVAVMSNGKTLKVEITREAFEAMIKGLLTNCQTIMEMVLDDAEMKWSDINKILLIGGSTRIPAVQEMIKKVSGIDPSYEIHPDEAVAMGAAIFASANHSSGDAESGQVPQIHISDVNSHSLGVVTYSEKLGKERNSIVLPRNTPLPAEAAEEFSTICEGQHSIDLEVTEGEDEDLDYVTIVGKAEIRLKSRPAGSPIEIKMQYDANGMIHVRVKDLIDDSDLGEMRIQRDANLSDEDVKNKTLRIAKINID